MESLTYPRLKIFVQIILMLLNPLNLWMLCDYPSARFDCMCNGGTFQLLNKINESENYHREITCLNKWCDYPSFSEMLEMVSWTLHEAPHTSMRSAARTSGSLMKEAHISCSSDFLGLIKYFFIGIIVKLIGVSKLRSGCEVGMNADDISTQNFKLLIPYFIVSIIWTIPLLSKIISKL